MREIKLSGSLRRFGRSFKLDVKSPAEALHALCTMIPGLKRELSESERKGLEYAVFVDSENIGEDLLPFQSDQGVIRIVPVLRGSARAGVLQTIIGVVLIVIGAAINIFSEGSASAFGTPIIGAGVSMVIGGIIQMLAPTSDGSKQGSTFFDGPSNTVAQGGNVPYLFGEGIIGSVRISAGIDILDLAVYGNSDSTDPVFNDG